MFGKPLSEYIRFQRPILMLIAVVWASRLVLSMAGVPVSGAQFLSVTGVLVLGALYYGWTVRRQGFGSYKELYGLNLVQGLFSQTLVALAILLAMALGQDNIYTTPEFYPPAQGIGVLGLPLPRRQEPRPRRRAHRRRRRDRVSPHRLAARLGGPPRFAQGRRQARGLRLSAKWPS